MAIKVFISYSWTSEEYKAAVLQLACDLRNDGVDVILDRWDLRSGHDMYTFMEKSIVEADKVLILCDKGYVEKANKRSGGVGTETAIITPDVYGHNDQEKFIPVVMDSFDVMPVYLRSRKGVDLRPGHRKEGYEELLRVIYEKPMIVKPPLGEMPNRLKQPTLGTKVNMFAELFDEGNTPESVVDDPTPDKEWVDEKAKEQLFDEIFGEGLSKPKDK